MYQIFIPKSKSLKKHIYNFCVLKEFDGTVNYLAFPQLGTTLAFYANANLKIGDNCITITKCNESNPQILLLGKYKLPIQIRYRSFLPEISINFTPTGLNYFFKERTGVIANKEAQLINAEEWIKITNQIFNQGTNDEKIDVLETFLIDNLLNRELSILENFISLLNKNPEYTISHIANLLGVSRKTINRCFNNYVGCSPMDFKKIFRFRKAIHTRFNAPFKSLSQIGFDSNFYDSPHFTREFKKLTQMNPRDFFSDVEAVVDKDIPYKFL